MSLWPLSSVSNGLTFRSHAINEAYSLSTESFGVLNNHLDFQVALSLLHQQCVNCPRSRRISDNVIRLRQRPNARWLRWLPKSTLALGHGPLTRYLYYGLRMRRECRERFPRHRLRRKPIVSDPGVHHGTCVTHVPWCMSESLTRGGRKNVPGIPGTCATHNFTYLARGPRVSLDPP